MCLYIYTGKGCGKEVAGPVGSRVTGRVGRVDAQQVAEGGGVKVLKFDT